MTSPDEVKDKFYNDLDDVIFLYHNVQTILSFLATSPFSLMCSLLLKDLSFNFYFMPEYMYRPTDLGRIYRPRRHWIVQQHWFLASKEVCLT